MRRGKKEASTKPDRTQQWLTDTTCHDSGMMVQDPNKKKVRCVQTGKPAMERTDNALTRPDMRCREKSWKICSRKQRNTEQNKVDRKILIRMRKDHTNHSRVKDVPLLEM